MKVNGLGAVPRERKRVGEKQGEKQDISSHTARHPFHRTLYLSTTIERFQNVDISIRPRGFYLESTLDEETTAIPKVDSLH